MSVQNAFKIHELQLLFSNDCESPLENSQGFVLDRTKLNLTGVILRNQLKVSRDEFWAAIRSGDPVDRPVALDESAPEYPAWVVAGLIRVGIAEAEIREMSPTEAEALLHQKWSETPK